MVEEDTHKLSYTSRQDNTETRNRVNSVILIIEMYGPSCIHSIRRLWIRYLRLMMIL